jgi:hypothetical protein
MDIYVHDDPGDVEHPAMPNIAWTRMLDIGQ